LQIEINRALYLDEDKIAEDRVRSGPHRLTRAMKWLTAIPLSQFGRPDSLPEAAE
jgi:hypothetical protein